MDTDTWWHLRAGQWMVQHKMILQQDLFSFTRFGEAWHYPGWLVQIPMYLIYQVFGPGGLNIWTAAIVAIAFGFSWATLKGGYFLKAFLLVLAATASGVFWSARPHLFTFLFTSITLFILEGTRPEEGFLNRRYLYALPVIMVLWANSHGGFATGFILWGIYWLSEQVAWISQQSIRLQPASLICNLKAWLRKPERTLTIVGLLMLLGACLNPSGPRMLAYPFQTVSIGALQDQIQEWQSPDFHALSVQPFLWLFFLGFGSLGVSRRRITLVEFLLFTGFAYLGFMAGRNIALFSLTAPVMISRHLDSVLSTLPAYKRYANQYLQQSKPFTERAHLLIICLVSLAVILKVASVFPAAVNQAQFEKYLPVKAVNYLSQSKYHGRLFNPYNWGGYLLWAAPGFPVFIDGRTDLFNDEIIQQWQKVVWVQDGWESILDDYTVNLILTETDSRLSRALNNSHRWDEVYQDEIAEVYQRRELLK